jgi:hypothetical protein
MSIYEDQCTGFSTTKNTKYTIGFAAMIVYLLSLSPQPFGELFQIVGVHAE